MPDVKIEPQKTLDLLDISTPALSATSDIPIVETKPDLTPAPKEEPKPETPPEVKEPEKAAEVEESAPSDKPDDPSASAEPKKAKGVQKRIDELTRQREDERRSRIAAEERLDRALAALEKGTVKDIKEESEPQKPVKDANNPEGYDAALEQYVSDRASWIAKREVKASLAEAEEKRKNEELQNQTKLVQDTYRARVEKAQEKYPDYREVAESPDVQVSIAMASAIAQAEDGPDLAYYLGKNPAEAERISKLIPQLQLVELGKISAKLVPVAQTSKAVSAAPKPGTPIKASSEVVKSDEEMSMEEYAAKRKKQWAEDRRPGVRH